MRIIFDPSALTAVVFQMTDQEVLEMCAACGFDPIAIGDSLVEKYGLAELLKMVDNYMVREAESNAHRT